MPTISRWTGQHFCALQDALALTNERMARHLRVATRTVANWRTRGHEVLPDLAQRLLPGALASVTPAVRERFDALAVNVAERESSSVDDVVCGAVAEVDADRLVLATDCGTESVAELWEDARTLARAGNRSALQIFTAAQRIRRQAHELAERTRRPTLLADLYVVVGQTSALMASTAFDLHRWNAADALARSAYTYAAMAGDSPLEAWVLGLQATLANWRLEPEAALRYFSRGLELAPPGAPRVRLRYIASRTKALLDDSRGIAEVLRDAERDRDDAATRPDRLSQETGGEFAFGTARAAACAAAAWLDVHDGERAEQHAQVALDELLSLPRSQRPFSQVSGTRIDIGTARALTGNVDGAAEAVKEVLTLPESLRNVSLAGRLVRLRDAVADRQLDDPVAHGLRDSIDAWIRDSEAIQARGLSAAT